MWIHKCPVGVREGVKKPVFLGLCLKLSPKQIHGTLSEKFLIFFQKNKML